MIVWLQNFKLVRVCLNKGIPIREVSPSWSKHELWEEAFITSKSFYFFVRIRNHLTMMPWPLCILYLYEFGWYAITLWKNLAFFSSICVNILVWELGFYFRNYGFILRFQVATESWFWSRMYLYSNWYMWCLWCFSALKSFV